MAKYEVGAAGLYMCNLFYQIVMITVGVRDSQINKSITLHGRPECTSIW